RSDPTYVPLSLCLFILVIGGVVLSAEGFVFRHMEISRLTSDSRRFLLAHFSFKDGLMMGIIGVIVGAVLIHPAVAKALEDLSEQQNTWVHASGDPVSQLCVRFLSDDWLGLSHVSTIYIEPETGTFEVYVFFVDPGDKSPDCPKPAETTPAHQRTLADGKGVTSTDPMRWQDIKFPGLTLVKVRIETTPASATKVKYGFEVVIYNIVLPVIGILVATYGALNLAFAGSMVPVKKKYRKGSMYQDSH
ncbi:MAG TPA: hypothetical protein VI893_10395, partial [Thermoplasmata archaeon]|nr:hypothetical protein [Thermoplasmata archaeon]